LLAQKKVTKEKSLRTRWSRRAWLTKSSPLAAICSVESLDRSVVCPPNGSAAPRSLPLAGGLGRALARAFTCATHHERSEVPRASGRERGDAKRARHRAGELAKPNGWQPVVSSLPRDVWPNRIEALFFGDFLLGQQKKVTRPPGRIPGKGLRQQTKPPAQR